MNRLSILCFLMIFPLTAGASKEGDPAGAAQAGAGGISIFTGGLWSVHNNPAGLAKLTHPMAGMYVEERFLIKDLFFKGGSLALPVKNGGVGLAVSHLGCGPYASTFGGIAFGRCFGEHFSAGLRFDGYQVSYGVGWKKQSALSFDAGIQWDLSDRLTVACTVFNPTKVKYIDSEQTVSPAVIRAGFSYAPLPELRLMIEGEKSSEAPLSVSLGMEYLYGKQFFVRAGLASNISRPTVGFGVIFSCFTVDVASSWHPTLGFTPSASVAYTLSQ